MTTARIAIVEDEAILRNELSFQLQHMGYEVQAFENSTQLYRAMAVRKFDIVILDIGLEGEDGLSICTYLRENDRQTGIVFVTARALRNDRLNGLRAGADAYLSKPIDIDELFLLIQRLIERSETKPAPEKFEPKHEQGWCLTPDREYLHCPGKMRVRMSANEVLILGALLRKPGEVVAGIGLAEALGMLPDEYNKHRIEVIISRLREKIFRETGITLPIMAKRGVGYYFLA